MIETSENTIKRLAENVISELGSGWHESFYEEALCHELRLSKIPFERQKNMEIIYKGYPVGTATADIVINNELLVELKAVKNISKNHIKQASVYLSSLGLKRGIVLNFSDEIQIKEVFPVDRKNSEKPMIQDSENPVFSSAKEVYDYFGTEFLYESRTLGIYTNALKVELRERGKDYIATKNPVIYKGHEIGRIDFEIVLNNEVVKVESYKNEDAIQEKLKNFERELKFAKREKGICVFFPEIEDGELRIEGIEIKL